MAWIPPRGSDPSLRIALAHGSLPVARRSGEPNYPIAADAPRRFDLDYIALGDWHTPTPNPRDTPYGRMYYSGAPEVGRWDETEAGYVLEVVLETGSEPRVDLLHVGGYAWSEQRPELLSASDVARLLTDLEELASPSRIVRVHPIGAISIVDREKLLVAVDELRPRFADLQYDSSDLRIAAEDNAALPFDPVILAVSRRLERLAVDPTDGLPAVLPKDLPNLDGEVIARALARFRSLLH